MDSKAAKTELSWVLILGLGLMGALVALASLGGYTYESEPWWWLIASIITISILLRRRNSRLFAHGLLIGLCWGLFTALIQISFFKLYLSNNPLYAAQFEEIPMAPALFLLISAPLFGLLNGVVIGGLASLINRIRQPRKSPSV